MHQYQGRCYQSEQSALNAVCSSSSFITSDGAGLTCLVSGSQIQLTKSDAIGTVSWTFTPVFQDCALEPNFLMQFEPALIGLLFASFIAVLMRKAL